MRRVPESPEAVTGSKSLVRGYSSRVFASPHSVKVGKHALSPLLPEIISSLSITPFQAGTALTITSQVFATVQYPSGPLSDDLTRKTVLVTSLSVVFPDFLLHPKHYAPSIGIPVWYGC